MGGFFNLDGPFARFGNMLADVVFLGLLWLVFSLPVVTTGAATTALFYVSTRRISNKEGYIFRDFWKSFRANFKQATVCWLILLVLAAVLFINITNIDVMGTARDYMLPIQLCIALELGITSLYVFPLIARFEMKLAEVFKNAFFMANRHPLITLGITGIAVSIALISYITVILGLVAMGMYAFTSSYLFMLVFRKYRPDMDRDEEL